VAQDEMEKIADGENERFIVSEKKFLEKVRKKAEGKG
jgi:predicted thioesterase